MGQVVDSIESTQKGVIEINTFKKVEKTFFSKNGNIIFFYFLSFYIILIFFLKKVMRILKSKQISYFLVIQYQKDSLIRVITESRIGQ